MSLKYHPLTWTAYAKKHRTNIQFDYCEKCGNALLNGPANYFSSYLYHCTKCGFKKEAGHVSFGVRMQFSNTYGLRDTHVAEHLKFHNGVSIKKHLLGIKQQYVADKKLSPQVVKKVWNRWAENNPIEIIKLAAISDQYILCCNNVAEEDNPINYLTPYIKNVKGSYLQLIDGRRKRKKNINKIKDAIRYIIRNINAAIWINLGNKIPIINENNLQASLARSHKHFFRSVVELYNYPQLNFPLFVTGPDISRLNMKQKDVDDMIFKELDYIKHDVNIIINTGNTGVETSALRWAVKNNKYAVAVSVNWFPYGDKTGYLSYDGDANTFIDRILNTSFEEN
jgi:hypothetical protein